MERGRPQALASRCTPEATPTQIADVSNHKALLIHIVHVLRLYTLLSYLEIQHVEVFAVRVIGVSGVTIAGHGGVPS